MSQKALRKALFWQLAGKRMLHDAAAVHYTALAEQQATEASLGLNHGTVVPLGVDTLVEDPSKDSQSLSSEISGVEGHPYVLVLSRLHPKKGLEVLLDAFLFLTRKKQFESWRLVLAGDGASEHVAKLRAKVKAHHANSRVLFPGWLNGEKKNAALRQASLLALPSHHENFGLCVMEALACGVPVLISPHVNLAPDIQAAGAGWITAVEDEAIKKALAEALDSRTERMKRGLAGYELSKKFTWSAVAGALLSLYSQILVERSQRHVA
jgi:glycosyltransferase involved in cell wall biosynthesis